MDRIAIASRPIDLLDLFDQIVVELLILLAAVFPGSAEMDPILGLSQPNHLDLSYGDNAVNLREVLVSQLLQHRIPIATRRPKFGSTLDYGFTIQSHFRHLTIG